MHVGVKAKPRNSVVGEVDLHADTNVTNPTSIEDTEQPKHKLTNTADIVREEGNKLSRLWKYVSNGIFEFVDKGVEWLEKSNSAYVEIVDELKQKEKIQEMRDVVTALESTTEQETILSSHSSVQHAHVEVHALNVEVAPHASSDQTPSKLVHIQESDVLLATTNMVQFTEEEDTEDDGNVANIEREFSEVAVKYSERPLRMLKALHNTLLAHAEYVIYFLVILNVTLNGSVLSLGFVCLLFAWGLLCIPWPSKTFWLAMIFYSMLVLVLKYGFQFYNIDYKDKSVRDETGFSTPSILGIQYFPSSADFFKNAAWDMLLLIALLINRGLLKVIF